MNVGTAHGPDKPTTEPRGSPNGGPTKRNKFSREKLERAMRFELTTPTLARLCSTPELRPLGLSLPTARL